MSQTRHGHGDCTLFLILYSRERFQPFALFVSPQSVPQIPTQPTTTCILRGNANAAVAKKEPWKAF